MNTRLLWATLSVAVSGAVAFGMVAGTIAQAESENPLPTIGLELILDNLTAPIGMVVPPDGSGRRFLVDMGGQVWVLGEDDTRGATPFLDLADRFPERSGSRNDPRGLLGLAFHPQYAENGRFFVFYTRERGEDQTGISHVDVLSEFTVSADDPALADLESERILLTVEQRSIEHAAGQLLFEPDTGYLLVTLGDDFSPETTSQDPTNLLGSVLRIDVDNATGELPYAIPADNPFANGEGGAPEVFAYGLRHPWRISADPEFGVLISDPAWTIRNQRVYPLVNGANYGWQLQDEPNCFAPDDPAQPLTSCVAGEDGQTFTPPLVEYAPNLGQIVIGGYVYRGLLFSELEGQYIFGDWGLNRQRVARLFTANPAGAIAPGGLWPISELATTPTLEALREYIWAFGQDAAGELYLMTTDDATIRAGEGQVYRLTRTDGAN